MKKISMFFAILSTLMCQAQESTNKVKVLGFARVISLANYNFTTNAAFYSPVGAVGVDILIDKTMIEFGGFIINRNGLIGCYTLVSHTIKSITLTDKWNLNFAPYAEISYIPKINSLTGATGLIAIPITSIGYCKLAFPLVLGVTYNSDGHIGMTSALIINLIIPMPTRKQ